MITTANRPSPTPRPRPARRRKLTVVLTVSVLAAAALTGYLAFRPSAPDVRPVVAEDGTYTPGTLPSPAGSAAVAAAVRAVPVALSYDFRSLDKNLAAAQRLMSADFATTFAHTFDKTARPMAMDKHAVTSALVRGAGLLDQADDEHARCLVYVDQILVSSSTMKSKKSPAKISQTRVVVELVRQDEGWRVDDILPR